MVAQSNELNARRDISRRAFSLIELLAVLAIVGLVSSAALLTFGHNALAVTEGEGFANKLMLDFRQARRRTISTGDDHYVLFARSGGSVTSYALYRDTGGGAVVVDRTVEVPRDVVITTAVDQWTFDFDGSVSGGTGSATIVVASPTQSWTLTVYLATGTVKISELVL